MELLTDTLGGPKRVEHFGLQDLKTEQIFYTDEVLMLVELFDCINKVKPDLVIVFEGSPADDTFYYGDRAHGAIGKGSQLRVIDGGMITNPRLNKYTIEIAKKNNLAHQVIVREKGSTNGAIYHKTNLGSPSVVLGVATRYAHSHYCYASYDDIIASIEIAKALIKTLNKEKIKEF